MASKQSHAYVTLLSLLTLLPHGDCEETKSLNLAGFLPMTGGLRPAGKAYIPPINVAVRHINAREDILAGYNLTYTVHDTQCDKGMGIVALYKALSTPPTKHLLAGPICSTVAETLAQASYHYNLSHFTFAANSPVLSDRKRYPKFFRISTPAQLSNIFRIALFQHFNWKKVATITKADGYFSAVADDLVKKLKATDIELITQEIYLKDPFLRVADDLVKKLKLTDIELITQEIYLKDPFLRVQNLKNKDARIIYAGSYEDSGRLVMCAAYRTGLYGPKIVWMFPGWYIEHWWRKSLENVPCTVEEMDEVAAGTLYIGGYNRNLKNDPGIAGIVPTEFPAMYRQEPDYDPDYLNYEHLSPLAYDMVWCNALALNCTDTVMKERGFNKTLDEFEYSDGDIGDIVASCILQIDFEGLSGRIKLTENGELLRAFKIVQIQDTYKVMVGLYKMEPGTEVEIGQLQWLSGGIKWRGGVPPRDSTQITMIEKSISVSLYVAMSVCATVGNLLAVGLLVFNIVYRDHVYVKLSSPNINNFLILGCILTYSSVYMYSYDEGSVVLCNLRHFTFTIGFTAAFGAMFSKTWRVYKIFCNKNLQRVKINDIQLIGIVVVMTGGILLILIIWQGVDPLYITTLSLRNEIYEVGNDAMAIPFLRECTSSHYYYFLWTVCILEGAMLGFGAFLSFETRKVRIEALNDARQIGMCLYNVIVLSAIVLILSILLSSQVQIVYGIFSGFVLLGTTTTLLIIFTPKIQSVFYPHSVSAPLDSAGDSIGTSVNRRIASKSQQPTTISSIHSTNRTQPSDNNSGSNI